jgi:hypothetical protein
MAVLPSYVSQGEWHDWYETNAMSLSNQCRARGRYEIAFELHVIATAWYEQNVVRMKQPGDTPEFRKRCRQLLAEYRAYNAEFPLLIATGNRLVEHLTHTQTAIERNKLKAIIGHQGVTAFGTICNQLDRGGWIQQRKEGKKTLVYPGSSPVSSDDKFIASEIPTPAELRRKADTAAPLDTLNVFSNASSRKGCFGSVFALTFWLMTSYFLCMFI